MVLRIFFSYCHRDGQDARALARALKEKFPQTWIDEEHLDPGDELDLKIAAAIAQCDAAVVCFGPNDFGGYQSEVELAALRAARSRGVRIVPILLPGCTQAQRAVLKQPEFAGLIWVEFPETVQDPLLLARLMNGLEGRLRDVQPAEIAEDRAIFPEIVERLKKSIQDSGAIAIVGANWGAEAADQLNRDALQFDFQLSGSPASGPVTPTELAALLHDVVEDDLESHLRRQIRYWNWQPLPAHLALARASKAILRTFEAEPGDRSRRSVTIVTTAMDLRVERALIAARVPFHRFALAHTGKLKHTRIDGYGRADDSGSPLTEFRAKGFDPIIRRRPEDITAVARRDFSELTGAIGSSPVVIRQDDWWDYVQDETALYDLTTEIYDEPGGMSGAHVLVVKLQGTVEFKETWRASYDDLLSWPPMPEWLLNRVRGALGVSTLLLMGFRLIDPSFQHMYANLFDGKQTAGRRQRGWLISPVDAVNSGFFDSFDACYRSQVDAAASRYKMKLIRDFTAFQLLDQLADAISGQRRPPNSPARAAPDVAPVEAPAIKPDVPVNDATAPDPAPFEEPADTRKKRFWIA